METDPRAESLRRHLAERRQDAEPSGGALEEAPAEPPADEFEAMRRRVHSEARAAAERMRRSGRAEPS
jgi:hypothetical protein